MANKGMGMAQTVSSDAERRIFTRMRLDAEVMVRVRGRTLGPCRVRDLGLGGVFVDAGGMDLYPNDLVDLTFPPVLPSIFAGNVVFRARVVRHAEQGIGLMFHDHDEASLDALREMMTGMPRGAGRAPPAAALSLRR